MLLAFVLCFSSAQAQNVEGQIIASQYGNWKVQGDQPNSYAFSPTACQVQGGASYFFAFRPGTPIRIVDGTPAYTETVTPTATIDTNVTCAVSIAPINPHQMPYYLTSGTGGLQEALNQNLSTPQPNTIILNEAFYQLVGGRTAGSNIIAAAQGSTNLGLVDITTNPYTSYAWNGTQYVTAGSSGGSIPCTTVANGLQYNAGGNFGCNPALTVNPTSGSVQAAFYGSAVGASLYANSVMVPTAAIHPVSGPSSSVISTINPPTGMSAGGTVTFIPTPGSGWVWDTTGNILAPGVASPGVAVTFTYNGQSWAPSIQATLPVQTGEGGPQFLISPGTGSPYALVPYGAIYTHFLAGINPQLKQTVASVAAFTDVNYYTLQYNNTLFGAPIGQAAGGIVTLVVSQPNGSGPFTLGNGTANSPINFNGTGYVAVNLEPGGCPAIGTTTGNLPSQLILTMQLDANAFQGSQWIITSCKTANPSQPPAMPSQAVGTAYQPLTLGGGHAGTLNIIATPNIGAPTYVSNNATGAATVSYVCSGTDFDGNAIPGTTLSIPNTPATWAAPQGYTVTCPWSAGINTYSLWRTVGGGSTGLIASGSGAGFTFNDTNVAATAGTPPMTNNSNPSLSIAGTGTPGMQLGTVNIGTGTGAPTSTCGTTPIGSGSLWLRTDGGASTSLYSCAGTTWNAVAVP